MGLELGALGRLGLATIQWFLAQTHYMGVTTLPADFRPAIQ